MTLVRTLVGTTILEDLHRVYICLAEEFLRQRGGGSLAQQANDPVALDGMVCSTEDRVDLREARRKCHLIDTDSERPAEVFNNLCHMFVILQAGLVLRDVCGKQATVCAPTQQSSHEGVQIPDLKGEGWLLEAFGGQDIANNGKLAKDLRKLAPSPADAVLSLLGLRESAWTYGQLPASRGWRAIIAKCSRKHGGPFSARAEVQLFGKRAGIVVLRTREIIIQDG